MKKRIFTFFLALVASAGTMFAKKVQIDDLYYNLDATKQTAEVTYKSNTNYKYNEGWGITTANIPASVTYSDVAYSVTSIGAWAFANCSGLTSVTIPNSVTSIANGAFTGCSRLITVTLNSNTIVSKKYASNINIGTKFGTQVKKYIIGEDVTSIGDVAFYNCSSLTSVTIPNSVTSIGSSAFSGCSGLTSIDIPNNVTSIGTDAFHNCSGLTSVNWNAQNCSDFEEINYLPFSGCSGITAFTIGDEVEHIPAGLCCKMSNLTSVMIPSSVTSIGNSAFSFCSGLKKVNITDIAAWCNITLGNGGSNPLNYAKHLYMDDAEVTNLIIPNSVTSIGNYAFYGCSGFTSVTIPNSITSIGSSAFEDCSGLTSVTIPNSVTSIGESAFENCSGMASVTIGNGVTSIGNNVFVNCGSLKSVTIGSGIQRINPYAFNDCNNLNRITLYAKTVPQLEVGFIGIPDEYYVRITVYVPADMVQQYKTAAYWRNFANILPISGDAVNVTNTTVTTTATTVDIAWPKVNGAASYELVIKDKNGNVFCTLIFDAEGHLTSLTFNAPARNNAPQQTQAAGFSFTITGLESGTTYNYTITAKGSNGNVLKTESGTFTTAGVQGFDEVQSDQVQGSKILRNGQILILRGEKVYTVTGQEVK